MTGFFDEIKDLLKNSMFNEIKELSNQEIKSNIIFENEIVTIANDNFIEINIKKVCEINEYLYSISRCKQKKLDLFIPKKIFFRDENYNLKEQKIFIIKIDDLKYFINISDEKLLISQNRMLHSNIHETVLNIDLINKDYKVIKYKHSLNYSTKDVKFYPQNKEYLKSFILEKKEAFKLVQDLLINLKQIDNIDDILNIENLYMILNIVKNEHYNPVITDSLITLSWPYKENKNINEERDVNLEIILNETREIVGEICFNYNLDGFSYRGNVGYFINEQYQNNHYATRALILLKELLKSNTFTGDKDLYLSIIPENIKSQSVAKNNGGELVYEGEVPDYNSINYIDGIEKVKIYRIQMK